MAGRLRNHKGNPGRLGRPAAGTMRHPTQGESDTAGITRKWFLFVDGGGDLHVLAVASSGNYSALTGAKREFVLDQLGAFWAGGRATWTKTRR
jgi:hypothetical protein